MKKKKPIIGLYLSTNLEDGGMFQYSKSLLESLQVLSKDEIIDLKVVYAHDDWTELLNEKTTSSEKLRLVGLSVLFSNLCYGLMLPVPLVRRWLCYLAPFYYQLKKLDTDFWIYPAQDLLSFQLPLESLATVHDLMHLYERRFPEFDGGPRFFLREYRFSNLAKYSAGILVDSDLGRTHLVDSYNVNPSKIYKLPFLPQREIKINKTEQEKIFKKLALPSNYLFYPSQFWPHKNHRSLLEAAKLVENSCKDLNLVFTGSFKNDYGHLKNYVDELNLTSKVYFVGRLNASELSVVYRRARGMVMPTFAGPTNIPPLEANQYGCPAAVSGHYAMPEQLGNAAIYFDPASVASIAEAISVLWKDKDKVHELRSAGYDLSKRWTVNAFSLTLADIIHRVCEN